MSLRRHAAFGFIFVTVLMDMLAFGVVMPPLPKLIADFLGGNTARASEFLGLFTTAFALMQFLASPALGVLSDRFGRRPLILLSNFGLAMDYFVMALAPSLGWLFLGRVLSGLSASSIPTATAYISDVTPAERRSKAFGLLGAAFGAGFVVGPALGGWLAMYSPRLPFWVAGAGSLLNAAYGLFILPESLPRERRTARFAWSKANPVAALKLLRSHTELAGLATMNFLGYLAHEVYATVWILFVMYRFAWSEAKVGAGLAVVGICQIVCSAGLVGPVVARFGDRRALLAGLFFCAAGFVLYGAATASWMIFAAIVVNSLWSLAWPSSQSLMTRRVSASEQGELQGAVASLRGIAMIIGPQMFSFTFAIFIAPSRHLPGAPWYLAALLVGISLPLAWRVTRGTRDADDPDSPALTPEGATS